MLNVAIAVAMVAGVLLLGYLIRRDKGGWLDDDDPGIPPGIDPYVPGGVDGSAAADGEEHPRH